MSRRLTIPLKHDRADPCSPWEQHKSGGVEIMTYFCTISPCFSYRWRSQKVEDGSAALIGWLPSAWAFNNQNKPSTLWQMSHPYTLWSIKQVTMAAKSGHTLINILEVKPLYTDKYKGSKYPEDRQHRWKSSTKDIYSRIYPELFP